jgi:hypothetical protein
MTRFILLILLLQGSLWAQSYIAPTTVLNKKGYQIGVSGDVFTSSKSIDKDGNDVQFEDGESFNRIQGEFFGAYGLTENLQIGGGVRVRQNNSKLLNASNEIEEESSTGVQSTFVSFLYAFKPIDQYRFSLEGQYRYMPFANEESKGTEKGAMILGDDGVEVSFGGGVTYASKSNNFLTFRGGYRDPGEELSPELYWQVEGALQWTHVALVAGVDGITTLGQDPYEGNPENKPVFYTGRTALYNSTDRELIAPYAGLNFAFNPKWRMEFRGGQVVSGKSTDLGTSFSLALIRRVEGQKKDRPDKRFKNYDFEAQVTKVSPKKGFVIIDKGLADDVQKGMKIDFYEFDYVGGNILLAQGIVIQSKADTAIVKITRTFNTKKELKEGVVARGSFR